MKKREIDILDVLPPEAVKQVDEVGYSLLREQGYDVEGVTESEQKAKKLKESMKKNKDELIYYGFVDKDTKAILIWFEIHRNKEKIATSRGLKFLPKPSEGGQGGERENQARPSNAPEDNT